ncbi:MAG: metal-dependent transcriptional regulator [Chloroflexi bacterium]|nr:metal-dependent transcriptional regulator [Chloroflexota bacterium]
MTTPTIEEYIEAIYIMQSEDSVVISARLAERMAVSAPTMTDTLKRMTKQGYVVVDRRKEINLTEKGKEVAESLVRRHRLSERWLTDVLGLDWSKAHQEACKLEHAISPEVEEKLSKALDNPSTCPHGNPIPGSGKTVPKDSISLNQVSNGNEVTVIRVSQSGEEDPRFLDYLMRGGIVPGAKLKVVEVAPWAGTVTVSSGENSVSIGMQAAAHVWVCVKR